MAARRIGSRRRAWRLAAALSVAGCGGDVALGAGSPDGAALTTADVNDPDATGPGEPESTGAGGHTGGGGSTDALDSSTSDGHAGPPFVDVAAAIGIDHEPPPRVEAPGCLSDRLNPDFVGGAYCLPERFAGGAAAEDVDRDGWTDLLITRAYGHDVLYRNRGDGTFEDISAASGLDVDLGTAGAAFGDVDNDGDSDLYISSIGDTQNYLWINDDGVFTEEAVERGAAVDDGLQHAGTSVAFGDYDNDGDLDLYMGEWRTPGLSQPWIPSHARLLRNRGPEAPGHFEDVTEAANMDMDGIYEEVGAHNSGTFVFSVAWTDMDRDGYADLLLAADFWCTRVMWGGPDGVFTDGTRFSGVVDSQNGMGSAMDDFDGDGDLDWYITDIVNSGTSGNRLYRYDGNRQFTNITDEIGVRTAGSTEWSWGTSFLDHDLDGDVDLAATNGWFGTSTLEDPMIVFSNDGAGNMTPQQDELGMADVSQGRGLISFDYDNDGDLDVVVVNIGGAPRFYRNEVETDGHWLRVKAPGTRSNTEGIGAQIFVDDGSKARYGEIGATGAHYLGHGPREVHFGLGPATEVDVRVYWPASGAKVVLEDVAVDQVLVVAEPD